MNILHFALKYFYIKALVYSLLRRWIKFAWDSINIILEPTGHLISKCHLKIQTQSKWSAQEAPARKAKRGKAKEKQRMLESWDDERWKLYPTAAPRKHCSHCTHLHLPPTCPGITLRVFSSKAWVGKMCWSCWQSFHCLPCMHLEPALNEPYGWQEVGSFLKHPFLAEMVQDSSTKPYKATCDPKVHLQKNMQHVSTITWILHPSFRVLTHCNYLFTKATQEWRGKSISCSPALNLKRWTRGSISYYESPVLFSSTDYSIIAFLVEYRSTLEIVHDGNSLGFLEFITTLIHSKHTGKHETIERAFQLSPWICHQMWNIMGKLSRSETYIFQIGKICKTTLHHV